MTRLPSLPGLLALAVLVPAASEAAAQDVELLGRIYGTRPPAGYYETRARNPDAYTFERAWKPRLQARIGGGGPGDDESLEDGNPAAVDGGAAQGTESVVAATLGRREGTVEGDFAFPVVLGLFSDSGEPAYTQSTVQTEFFDGPNSEFKTVPQYYDEISGGRVRLDGVTHDWVRTDLTREEVTDGESGLGPGQRVGEFIVHVVSELDAMGVDWGRFDNDGPDGVPNSGDDDGYVDVLAVIHPTRGAECGGSGNDDRIWSHRWTLSSAWSSETDADGDPIAYQTETPSQSTDHPIRINDYTIQPLISCDGVSVNEIGVMAHELGHGFGLPDLYATNNSNHTGVGNWALMGTGTWGCRGGNPSHPCHMSAWSKAVLGWVDVVDLTRGEDLGTLELPPVESSGTVYRVAAGDGSGEYFLLENRQPQPGGFDEELYAPGLLLWHIDPDVIESTWPTNTINNDRDHLGIWLRQADGQDDLARSGGGRGDAGDPYPGSTGQTVFHASSAPASFTHDGRSAGVTFLEIGQGPGEAVSLRAVTRYQDVRLQVEGTASADEPLLTVDGQDQAGTEHVVRSAPFEEHVFEAAPGQEESEGVRISFQGWEDGAPRIRDFVTPLEDVTLVATYGGRELRVAVELLSPVEGLSPGSVVFDPGTPDGWVPEGATVTVAAEPRTGFAFAEWGGALADRENPTTLTVDEPADASARFEKTFAAATPGELEVRAAVEHAIELVAANANSPVTWTLANGSLPDGMRFESVGRISGAALEKGSFPLTLDVQDGIGLEATATLVLEVQDPGFSLELLTGPFLAGDEVPQGPESAYLDRNGNGNGGYDLGDLRAYVLDNPDLPMSGELPQLIRMLVPAVDMKSGASADSGDTGGGGP